MIDGAAPTQKGIAMRRTTTCFLLSSFVMVFTTCNSEELCDKRIRDKCLGCSPYLEQFRIEARSLNPTLLTEVKRCADLSADASIKSAELAKGTFKGCISSNKKIDDKSRDALLKLIEKVPVPDKQYDHWLSCYSEIVDLPAQKPVVVLMDSHLKDVVYCSHTQEIGGSNADDIINLIKDLPVAIATVATNLEWKNDQQVIDMHPALVIVHASAFYKETQAIDGNQRLLDFLDSMKNTQTKILVYTRAVPDQSHEDVQARFDRVVAKLKDPSLKSRAQLFVIPKGQSACFDDPEIAVPFKSQIKDMLALK
jgi:hypothetical protein